MASDDSNSSDCFSIPSSQSSSDAEDDDEADIAKLDAFFAELKSEESHNPKENPQDSIGGLGVQLTRHTNSRPTEPNDPRPILDPQPQGGFNRPTHVNSEGDSESRVLDSCLERTYNIPRPKSELGLFYTKNVPRYKSESNSWCLDLGQHNEGISRPETRPVYTGRPSGVHSGGESSRNPDLLHLLYLNDEAQASLKQIKDELLSKLELTRFYKRVMENQAQVEGEDSLARTRDAFLANMNCLANTSMPYFKDERKFRPPSNRDALLKRYRGEFQDCYRRVTPWADADVSNLALAMKESEIEGIAEKKEREMAALRREIKRSDADETKVVARLKERLEKLDTEVNIVLLQERSLKELVGSREREHDWLKVSATYLKGVHGPLDCQIYWENWLDPRINKGEWTRSEDHKLKGLPLALGEQDWDEVAETLDTGRTPMQCAKRFQELLVDGFVTHVWFSKQEDQLLREKVATARKGKKIIWSKVMPFFPRRTRYQLYRRWTLTLSDEAKDSRLSCHEDVMLASLVRKHGRRFRYLVRFFPGRSSHELKRRHRQLSVDVVHGAWTREDDEVLYRLGRKHREKMWTHISEHFVNRTPNQARFRYFTLKRGLAKQLEETGEQDLSKLKVFTRMPVSRAKQKAVDVQKREVAMQELEATVKFGTRTKVEPPEEPEKFDRLSIKFREYLTVGYGDCVEGVGGSLSRRATPLAARAMWLVLGTLAADLRLVPSDRSRVLTDDSLDNLSKAVMIHFMDNNVSLCATEREDGDKLERETEEAPIGAYESPKKTGEGGEDALGGTGVGGDTLGAMEDLTVLDLELPVVSAGEDITLSLSTLISSEVIPLEETTSDLPRVLTPVNTTSTAGGPIVLTPVSPNTVMKALGGRVLTAVGGKVSESALPRVFTPIVLNTTLTAAKNIRTYARKRLTTLPLVQSAKPSFVSLTSDPLTSEPVTSNLLASEPVTSEPLASKSVTSDPVTSKPVTSEPLASKSVTSIPVTSKPVTSEPLASKSVTSIPLTSKPVTSEPLASKSVISIPLNSEPLTSKSLASKPVTSKPVTFNPLTSAPLASKPVTSKPVTSKPVTSNPLTSAPLASKPVTSKPVPSAPPGVFSLTSAPLASTLPLPKAAHIMVKKTDNGQIVEVQHFPTKSYRNKPTRRRSAFRLKHLPVEPDAQPTIYLPPHDAGDVQGEPPPRAITQFLPPSLNLLVGFCTLRQSKNLLWKYINPLARCRINNLEEEGGSSSDGDQPPVKRKTRGVADFVSTKKRRMDNKLVLPDNIPREDLWLQRLESLFWFPAIMSARRCCLADAGFSNPVSDDPFRALDAALRELYPGGDEEEDVDSPDWPAVRGSDSDLEGEEESGGEAATTTKKTRKRKYRWGQKKRPKPADKPCTKKPTRRKKPTSKKKPKVHKVGTRKYIRTGRYSNVPTVTTRPPRKRVPGSRPDETSSSDSGSLSDDSDSSSLSD